MDLNKKPTKIRRNCYYALRDFESNKYGLPQLIRTVNPHPSVYGVWVVIAGRETKPTLREYIHKHYIRDYYERVPELMWILNT
jgi:hypothetical protein